MVLGLDRGYLTVKLPKHRYKLGEEITGTVLIRLKEATVAKELRIELIGERQRKRGQTKQFYVKKKTIRQEGSFRNSESQFSITIPDNLQLDNIPEGTLGNALKVARSIGIIPGPPRWYVKAVLNVPMAMDTSSKEEISISRPGPKTGNI